MNRQADGSRPSSQNLSTLHENPEQSTDGLECHDAPTLNRFGANLSKSLVRDASSTAIDGSGLDRFQRIPGLRNATQSRHQSVNTASNSSRSNTDHSDQSVRYSGREVASMRNEKTQESVAAVVASKNDEDENKDEIRSIGGRSETSVQTRKDLGAFDVAALIINKQIGTGIFTTPGLVLSLTGSKTTSLIMWFCGGIWAFLSVIIYVEFGSAFPFNGGELIYLDEVFRKPELLATMLFSAFFITVPNTDGNSLQFAKHVLLAAQPYITDTSEIDKRLLSFVAVTVLSVVCLIHFFSRNSGLVLNLLFATFKILLVISFIVGGCIASKKPGNGVSDWGEQPVTQKNVLAGMIYIIYSYQGWENANYVGGELKVASRDLKRGAFWAVGLVTILYTLVTMAYCLALEFHELAGADLAIIIRFVPKVFGESSVLAVKICIALSAFGNLIAVVYTSAKVKQQIARQCIIPFYKHIAAEDPHRKTPTGAIFLHWIFALLWIVFTPNTSDGYGFVIGLFIYGQLVVGFFVAVAFFFIRQNYETGLTRNAAFITTQPVWKPVILSNKPIRIICAVVFMGMNLMVLVQGARGGGHPPTWVRPAVIFGVLGVTSIVWAVLRIIAKSSGPKSSIEIRIIRDGIEKPIGDDQIALRDAKLEGNSRVVIYETHGKLKNTLRWFQKRTKRLRKHVIR